MRFQSRAISVSTSDPFIKYKGIDCARKCVSVQTTKQHTYCRDPLFTNLLLLDITKLSRMIDFIFGKSTVYLDLFFANQEEMAMFVHCLEIKLKGDIADNQFDAIEFVLSHCKPGCTLTTREQEIATRPLFMDPSAPSLSTSTSKRGVFSILINYGYIDSDGELFKISRPLCKTLQLTKNDLNSLGLLDTID